MQRLTKYWSTKKVGEKNEKAKALDNRIVSKPD
jgi:hypothetical protein